jgi:N-acetylmuramoyl-L-alanine amidase
MLVLHYTGMVSGAAALQRLCDPSSQVSAHYMIDEDGSVYALVGEDRRAWHAGVSFWRGVRDINSRSIGIELVNPGHQFGYGTFPAAQMAALAELAAGVLARHPIPARNVVGHSDIAPARRSDPGELFDWRGLAAQGIGLWPAPAVAVARDTDIAALLDRFGYDVVRLPPALIAFQRHFRPRLCDGVADLETKTVLGGLMEMVDQV